MRLETLLALGELPPKHREALFDMDVLDRTSDQIARDMGCSAANVRMAAKRGRLRLATLLRKDYDCECF